MSSEELSLAEDSQDEVLSVADDISQTGEVVDDMDDLFGDNDSESDQQP
jgi:hypothetical protein